jgi:hypothetical protein
MCEIQLYILNISSESILFPMMADVLQKSQNPDLLESVHAVMKTMFSYQHSAAGKNKLTRMFLNDIGYHKLPECATFNIEPEAKREITKLVIVLLENLLKDVSEKLRSRNEKNTLRT